MGDSLLYFGGRCSSFFDSSKTKGKKWWKYGIFPYERTVRSSTKRKFSVPSSSADGLRKWILEEWPKCPLVLKIKLPSPFYLKLYSSSNDSKRLLISFKCVNEMFLHVLCSFSNLMTRVKMDVPALWKVTPGNSRSIVL